MKKVKRPFKKIDRLYFGGNTKKKMNKIKKPYIEDGKLYLSGGKRKQTGGLNGLIASQLLPVGIEIAKNIYIYINKKKEKTKNNSI